MRAAAAAHTPHLDDQSLASHLTRHPTRPAGDHETSKDVPLTIYNDDQYEKEEFLKVVLEDVRGGATFAAGPNGEEVSSCTCQVGSITDYSAPPHPPHRTSPTPHIPRTHPRIPRA